MFSFSLSYLHHLTSPLHKHLPHFNESRYVVFSHGLAGHMNAYSNICMELASNGYTIICVQHRHAVEPFDSKFSKLK